MRISSKMTVSLSAASLVALSVHGAWQVNAERRDLEASVEHEVRLMGRILQVAAEHALRDHQVQDITVTLEKLEGVDSNVDIYVYDLAGRMNVASPGHRPRQDVMPPVVPHPAASAPVYRMEGPPDALRVILVHPLHGDDGRPLGHLVVVRPLDDQRMDLSRTEQRVGANIALLVVLVALVQFALGRRYITAPMERLARAMRSVRMDNMSMDIAVPGDDEVDTLAVEFNAMLAELRSARRLLAEQAEARQHAERHLQEVNKLAAIGQLSAGLAHEIGSPLQVINGRARALLGAARDEALVKRTAQILVEQSDRITRTVENLLRFTRRTGTSRRPTRLEAAAASVVEFLEVEARRNGVSIVLDAPAGLPAVVADEDQVQQVVLNLLSNALHASQRGGTIEVTLRPVDVPHPGTRQPTPAVRLTVTDHGVGMQEAVRERLFEPFFTTRADQGGTGLGLAVVKAIAQDHGAALSVDSVPGRGTSFHMDFLKGGVAAGAST